MRSVVTRSRLGTLVFDAVVACSICRLDAEGLPLLHRATDLVICRSTLDHIADLRVAEVRRA